MRLKTKEAELSLYLSFSISEDLILLKSTFVEMQGRPGVFATFLYEYKPLTLRLSYGFASILSGAATPVSALTRHKILLLQCACVSVTSPSDFSSSDTAPEWRRFTFCSISCSPNKPRNALQNAYESNLLHKSEYQLQERINSHSSRNCQMNGQFSLFVYLCNLLYNCVKPRTLAC